MFHLDDLSQLNPEVLELNNLTDEDLKPQKNPNRVEGGKKAGYRGSLAEDEFDAMGDRYMTDGLCLYIPQYAPFIERGKTQVGRKTFSYGNWDKKGEGDRIIFIPGCGFAMVEIKSMDGKHYRTLDKGLHQFDRLKDINQFDDCFGAYLLRWQYDEGEQVDWRLYPAEDLQMIEGGIKFYRATGIEVEMEYPTRYPIWLPTLKRVMECLSNEKE